MCGIFGAIGRGFNPNIFRSLAIANQSRGNESFGCFAHKAKIYKKAGLPVDVVGSDEFGVFLNDAYRHSWFVCGHTRYSTRGSGKVTENAHPFQYGSYIGVHNGVIQNSPMTYTVDSQYIWDQLNKNDGNYQKAWENMKGTWGVAWTDGKFVYLQTYHQVLSMCTGHDGVFYFSSDAYHLRAATGVRETQKFDDGDTFKFLPNGSIEKLTSIKVKEYSYATTNRNYEWGGYNRHYSSCGPSEVTIDYQERFTGCWNPKSLQMEFMPKKDYYERRFQEAEKIATAQSELADADLASFSDEWESYMQFENKNDDTDVEVEDATGLIVVEDTPQLQEAIAEVTSDAQEQKVVAN